MPMTALDEEILTYAEKIHNRDPDELFSARDFIKDTAKDHRNPHQRTKVSKRLKNLNLYGFLDAVPVASSGTKVYYLYKLKRFLFFIFYIPLAKWKLRRP